MRSLFLLLILFLPSFLCADDTFLVKKSRLPQSSGETIEKGCSYVGFTFSARHSKGENFNQLFIIPIDQEDALSFSVDLFGGYFPKKYFSVGTGISYMYSRRETTMDTLTVRLAQSGFAVEPHIRTYLPWTEKLFFQIFNQTNLSVGYGTGVEESDNGSTIDRTQIGVFEAELGFQPGLSVFVAQGVSIEASVNLLGLKYKGTKITQNGEDFGFHHDTRVNFDIDIFSLNLGMNIYF